MGDGMDQAERKQDEGVSRDRWSVSRRGVAKGIAAASAVLGAASLAGCGSDSSSSVTSKPQVITDDSKIVNVTEEYENVDCGLQPQFAWDLPLGTVPVHCEGSWAALLEAPASARAVNTLGIISLVSGQRTTLFEQPTQGRAFGFHDVRCAEGVFAWVEMDYATGEWVLLASQLENGSIVGDAWSSIEATWTGSPHVSRRPGRRSSGKRCPWQPVRSEPNSPIVTCGVSAMQRARTSMRARVVLRRGRA